MAVIQRRELAYAEALAGDHDRRDDDSDRKIRVLLHELRDPLLVRRLDRLDHELPFPQRPRPGGRRLTTVTVKFPLLSLPLGFLWGVSGAPLRRSVPPAC